MGERDTTPPAARPAAPRAGRRTVLAGLIAVTVLLALAAGAWTYATRTEAGLRLLLSLAQRGDAVRIDSDGLRGTLSSGLAARRLVVRAAGVTVELHDADLRIAKLGWMPLRVDLAASTIGRLKVHAPPSPSPGTSPPEHIGAPLAIRLDGLRIGAFELGTDTDPGRISLQLGELDLRGTLEPDGYVIETARFAAGAPAERAPRVELSGRLGGARPFPVDLRGTVAATVADQPLRAEVVLGGSLVALAAAAAVQGAGATGAVGAQLASFDRVWLRALNAELRGIDPRVWHAEAPSAQLDLKAQLAPADASAGSELALSGSFDVLNRAPGPLDGNQLPFDAARGTLDWTPANLALRDLDARVGDGRVRGTAALALETGAWQADVRLDALDPRRVHTRARSLRIDGNLAARSEVQGLAATFALTQRDAPKIEATGAIALARERLAIPRLQLRLGEGRAEVEGEVGLPGATSAAAPAPSRLRGRFERLDPALLVNGLSARLTGRFEVDGRIAPNPAGTATVEIADSQWAGRALRGTARLALGAQADAPRGLDVDADLVLAGASVKAAGGLGAPDRSLRVSVDAPSLRDLAGARAPLDGRVRGEATLRGDWSAPAIEATLTAEALEAAGHRVAKAQVVLSSGGGAEPALKLAATASNHRAPGGSRTSLRTATLALDGTPSAHGLRLDAVTEDATPLMLAARGAWRDSGWRGTLETLTAGRPYDLSLLGSAPVQLDARRQSIGPLRLSVAGATIEDAQFALDDGRATARGRFAELRPATWLETSEARRDTALRAPEAAEPLALRGAWDLRLDAGDARRRASAEGTLRIERAGGDLVPPGTREALGITELIFEARIVANRLRADFAGNSRRGGTARATLEAEVEHDPRAGWRLAQQRPLALDAGAQLESLDFVNAVMSARVQPHVRLGGALAASIQVRGTPAQPRASGTLTGERLRVAWVDQGVRLDNGTLRARLDGDALILDSLRFAGPPRVRPADPRAARVAGERSGTLEASGRLQLADGSGVIQVAAQQVPLLQAPTQWVIATGGANIVFSPRAVAVNGAVVAEGGFIDISRSGARRLSDDVSVVRSADNRGERVREPAVALTADLGIDLGSAFYLRGLGLDTRAEGQVRVRMDKGVARATGAVEAREGRYTGFGQNLELSRARVNFQGPLENPGLDVLALRRGVPVEVGVTITGTALAPLVRLHSNPAMPDVEVLSWLTLGTPAAQGQQDRTALAMAAVGVLSGTGDDLAMQTLRKLGIDEFAIRSGDFGAPGSILPRSTVAGATSRDASVPTSVSTEILTVGKRFGDSVTVSIEQALGGAASALLVSYRLSKSLSLVARAGTDSALDLVYSIAFD